MRSERKTPWLTMTQAAALIGETDPQAGRRLRWRLLTVQRRQRCRVLIDAGRGERRKHYVTSETLLRRWCPELFATHAHLPETIRTAIRVLEEADANQVKRIQATRADLRAVNMRCEAIEARLDAAGL